MIWSATSTEKVIKNTILTIWHFKPAVQRNSIWLCVLLTN